MTTQHQSQREALYLVMAGGDGFQSTVVPESKLDEAYLLTQWMDVDTADEFQAMALDHFHDDEEWTHTEITGGGDRLEFSLSLEDGWVKVVRLPDEALDAIRSQQPATATNTREALTRIAEICECHPMYLGAGLSIEEICKEGGDAATITDMAYIAREALEAADVEVVQPATAVPADLASQPNPWRAAIDEALIACALDCTHDGETAEQALARLIAHREDIVLDPAVSDRARALASQAAGQPAGVPDAVSVSRTWLEAMRGDINTLAALSLRAERHAFGARLKGSVSAMLATQPAEQQHVATAAGSNTPGPHNIVKLPPLPEPESRERVYGGHGNESVHYWYSNHQMREYARQAVHEAEGAWQSRCTALAHEAWTWSKILEGVTSAKLTDEQIDAIAADGMRNAAGGIYATSVYDFARAVERAAKSSA